MYLSRRGGLVCQDCNSQLLDDDRICFNGLGIPDLNAPAQTSSRVRIATSSLLVLNLQLAIRLVSFSYEPSTVADAVLASGHYPGFDTGHVVAGAVASSDDRNEAKK